jgi:predicted HTH transcriptional regulator
MTIEELRRAIEHRLTEAREEIERLEAALSALGHGHDKRAAVRSRQARRQPRRSSRTPRVTTRQAVLEALGAGEAMTASQVAAVTGLRSQTIAPELSKLVKTGELIKAARGYTAPPGGDRSPAASARGTDAGRGERAEKSAAVRALRRELDAGLRTRL